MENPLIKKAKEELLRIADEIEREAWEKISFSCDSCEHTANMAEINSQRKTAAESLAKPGTRVTVASINVEDQLQCPSCSTGKMAYVATEDSEKYLVEAGDEKEAAEVVEQDYDTLKAAAEEAEAAKKKGDPGSMEKTDERFEGDDAEASTKEASEEDPVMTKAASLGLDLEAVARYAEI